jgi:hypothetical protein
LVGTRSLLRGDAAFGQSRQFVDHVGWRDVPKHCIEGCPVEGIDDNGGRTEAA